MPAAPSDPQTTPGFCPRCKTERELTILIGGMLRCGWCSLVLRAHEPTTMIVRRDTDPSAE